MAANKFILTKSLWSQLGIIATIVSSSIFGFRFLVSEIKDVVKSEIATLTKKVDEHEEGIDKLKTLLAANKTRTDAAYLSANVFIDSYNKLYHREFLRPIDITEETIVTEIKKRR